MRRIMLLMSAVALTLGLELHAQQQQPGHEQAIAAIRNLGGEVAVDATKSDAPVSVVLTGSKSPTECLPYLQRVNNLHTCDL
jgi:hypothetical protein